METSQSASSGRHRRRRHRFFFFFCFVIGSDVFFVFVVLYEVLEVWKQMVSRLAV